LDVTATNSRIVRSHGRFRHARSLSGRRACHRPRDDHVSGSCVHRHSRARHHPRSGIVDRADGLRVHGLSAGLCAVRDSYCVVGRSPGNTIRSLADRVVVVGSDVGDGRRIQLSGNAGRSLPVRHGRGRGMAVRGAYVFTVDSGTRARPGPGRVLRWRSPRWRSDADARPVAAQLPALARDLLLLRHDWIRLGCHLARLVPQRPIRASIGERGRTGDDCLGPAARHQPRGRMGILGATGAQPEHARHVRHVHPQLHDLLLLHHLASLIPEATSRIRRGQPWHLRRSSADRQHARRCSAGW